MSKDKFLMPKSRPNNAKKNLETLSKEGHIEQLTSEEIERILEKKPKKQSLNNKIENSEQIKEMLENPFSRDVGPEYIEIETGKKSKITPKKFSSGKLAEPKPKAQPSIKLPLDLTNLIGPSKPKGSVSPKMRAYDDKFQSEYGAGVNVTTKKGVSFDFDVDKTEYKGTDYKEPESYKASVEKQGDKFSYGLRGTKKGKSRSVEAGITFKYKDGGMCRGMGKAIRGGKFTGVK